MTTYIPTDPLAAERQKRSKYKNKKCKMAGQKFDSCGERDRFFYLNDAQRQGRIRNLQCQVKYALVVNDELICHYIADFIYEMPQRSITAKGEQIFHTIVEDFKGGYRLPPDWPIKQKLMKACHGIDVIIVKQPTARIGT